MQWLSDNYKWLFDGIGAIVVIGVLSYLLRRFVFTEPAGDTTKSSLRAEESQVTGSPAISGSGNITTIHVGHPPATPAPPAPVVTRPEDKPRPNMRQTGARVIRVNEFDPGRFVEDSTGRAEAVVIQFTNEAKQQGKNVGGNVKASLVYEDNGVEILRIIGAWMHGGCDSTTFDVDDSHKLVVGVALDNCFGSA